MGLRKAAMLIVTFDNERTQIKISKGTRNTEQSPGEATCDPSEVHELFLPSATAQGRA